MSAGNTKRQIKVLQSMGSSILCCTPSYAMHIADTAIEMDSTPKRTSRSRLAFMAPRRFRTSSARTSRTSSATKVYDVYGLTEVMGPASPWNATSRTACMSPRTIFRRDSSILRLERARRRVGQLVITTLTKEASPVVRYRTRDITRIMPGECPGAHTSHRSPAWPCLTTCSRCAASRCSEPDRERLRRFPRSRTGIRSSLARRRPRLSPRSRSRSTRFPD